MKRNRTNTNSIFADWVKICDECDRAALAIEARLCDPNSPWDAMDPSDPLLTVCNEEDLPLVKRDLAWGI